MQRAAAEGQRAGIAAYGARTSDAVVVARALKKAYDGVEAVRGIDFEVPRGECFGLLGPNGAGKTTTIRMINCTAQVTSGELRVLGRDVRTDARVIKARLGLVPQENNPDPDFSVRKNLTVYARYFGITGRRADRKADELLAFMALSDRAHAHVEHLSGGLKRRLIIARGLVNEPDVLILDEPTTGLDPQARHAIWEKVRELRRRGVTILLTTHYMDEAEALCDRLIIIDRGQIIARGRPRELIQAHAGREVLEVQPRAEEDTDPVQKELEGAGLQVERSGEGLIGYAAGDAGGQLLQPVADRLAGSERVQSVTLRRATLEDVFLRLTGRALRE